MSKPVSRWPSLCSLWCLPASSKMLVVLTCLPCECLGATMEGQKAVITRQIPLSKPDGLSPKSPKYSEITHLTRQISLSNANIQSSVCHKSLSDKKTGKSKIRKGATESKAKGLLDFRVYLSVLLNSRKQLMLTKVERKCPRIKVISAAAWDHPVFLHLWSTLARKVNA